MDDAEFLEARQLEKYLDELPDYLDWGISAEYSKAKLEFHAKGADE